MTISRIKNESAQTSIKEASKLVFSKEINPNYINFGTVQGSTTTLQAGDYFVKYITPNAYLDTGATIFLGDSVVNKGKDALSILNLSTSESKEIISNRSFSFSTTRMLRYVVYENNLLIGTYYNQAPGDSGGSFAVKSTDGINWSEQKVDSGDTISEIFFAKATNKYYTLIDNQNWRESTDFITWTSSISLFDQEHLAYVNNLYFRKPRGTARIQSSTDFITWTTATTFAPEEYEDITYFNGYYIVANRTTIRKSTNGIVWTSSFNFVSSASHSIARNNYGVISSAYQGNSISGTTITVWSTDLINWSTVNVPGFGLAKVKHINNAETFIINFASSAFISNDGISWTTATGYGRSRGSQYANLRNFAVSQNKAVIPFSTTSLILDFESKSLLQIYKK